MSKELKALKRIRTMYQNFVKKSRDLEPKLMICEKEDFAIIETALKRLEQQDSVLKTLKEVIKFSQTMPRVEPNEHNGFSIRSAISINVQRDIENKERELLRQWVLKTCFPKELKALEIIKENLNIDEILLAVKGVCKASDYDLVKEVLL